MADHAQGDALTHVVCSSCKLQTPLAERFVAANLVYIDNRKLMSGVLGSCPQCQQALPDVETPLLALLEKLKTQPEPSLLDGGWVGACLHVNHR